MSDETIRWIAGILLGSFTIQFGIFILLLNDKVTLPGKWVLFLSVLYTVFSGVVLYWGFGLLRPSGSDVFWIVFFNTILGIVFAISIVVYVTLRYRKGIEFGEEFISTLSIIDLQINYILCNFRDTEIDELQRSVDDGLSFVLDTIAGVLNLNPGQDKSHISILLARQGQFQVIAQNDIPPNHIRAIENKFRYGREVVGVAGRAATTLKQIYISDVSDNHNLETHDWVAVEPGEEKEGSLYCYPIKRGVGQVNQEEPLAVLSITSKKKKAFDRKSLPDIIPPIASKIETFIYLLEMHDFFDDWLEPS